MIERLEKMVAHFERVTGSRDWVLLMDPEARSAYLDFCRPPPPGDAEIQPWAIIEFMGRPILMREWVPSNTVYVLPYDTILDVLAWTPLGKAPLPTPDDDAHS